MDVNDPLNFELEDEFLKSPPIVSNKRRKKVIGLDDILTDLLREQRKLKEEQNEQKKSKTKKAKKDLKDFGEEEDIPLWGVKVFADKKAFPPLEFPELGTCNLLQSFLNSELNSVVELAVEKGDNFLEGLLINGWLPKLAFLCGHIEKPVAIWSFNTSEWSKRPVFSVVEAEELIEIIICLFLDRQFQGLLVLLNDFVEAIVNYFTDQEWHSSCENIAKFIASRVSKNLNCIQFVECIPVASSRCKQLKSAMVYQNLLSYFDGAHNEEDILRLLRAINFKDKSCDFFKMYIHLVLTENWVLSNSLIEDNPVIYEMFCLFLRQCSSLISASDLRSYASMVRHRAAYLMHFSIYK
ncbi:uncharacterized protein LOC107473747 [Arachis duranensis]|uniref:Uncharacterized protein LOC107473747 n=1 Tax=Arachis duranensis TaxID=130453 RepID=A0A9C6TRQ2_ARADU|nr:uncharacterized protein LOC107473747 [Arachis duranensis]